MTRRSKLIMIAAGTVAILAVAGILGASSSDGKADATKGKLSPVAVEVSPVRKRSLSQVVSAVGTIAAMRDVAVASETAGRITRVAVNVGDHVKSGQVLVQVDDELKKIAVDQARAQLLAAETNLAKARNDLRRAETLFATGDIADIELEAMRLAFHSAEAQHKSADVGLRFVQRQFEDTQIKAPIPGTIVSKKVELGEMVSPGQEVANLVDISKVKVSLSIPEEEIVSLNVGQAATLRIDSRPGSVYQGQVLTIGSKTESPTGHAYPVEVVVENRNVNALKVGMFARVTITARQVDSALTISKESLVSDDGQVTAFVVEQNIARLRTLTIGIRSDELLQVVKGLREGDLVISFGQKNVKDGAPVTYEVAQGD